MSRNRLPYLLTPWCRVLFEKLPGLQLVKKFPAFHGTRRFITALTSFRRNRLPRVMKHYFPTGRRNHGRPLKRLQDTWDRNGSTSGPTPWNIYDDDGECRSWIFRSSVIYVSTSMNKRILNFRRNLMVMRARSLETSESDLQLTQCHVPEQRNPHFFFPVLLIK